MQFRKFARVYFLMAMLCSVAYGQKLKIVDVQWGFDGRVTPNEFNPVSILMDNQGDEAFEGNFVLRQRRGTGQAVGAAFESVAYLPPLQRSWVRFVPYMSSSPNNDDWGLSWVSDGVSETTGTKSRGSDTLPKVQPGASAIVLFSNPEGLGSGAKGIKYYDESLFPTSVTATHGLETAVLDHQPRWLAPQRQAFADWLLLGGQVHLLKSDDGEYPSFSEELSILNGPTANRGRRVGSGAVYYHDLQASQIKSGTKFPALARRMETAFRGVSGDPDETLNEWIQQRRSGGGTGFYSSIQYGWDAADRAHGSLMEITQPDHNWALIFILAVLYILMIFPGCYLLGRRRVHYLVTYGGILGAATLFSIAFLIIGRRGYGEQTEINSVAVLQKIEGDRWDVVQWSNAFVTVGGEYELIHNGNGAVYSSGNELERVNGRIALADRDDDKSGRSFIVDIPPFSNRPFVHRQTVSISGLEASLVDFAASNTVTKATIKVGSELQNILSEKETVKIIEDPYRTYESAQLELPIIRLAYQDQLYSLKYDGKDQLTFSAALGRLHSTINVNSLKSPATTFGAIYGEDKPSPKARYVRMFDAMLAHRFGIFKDVDFTNAQLRNDVVRLLIYAPMPDELRVSSKEFTNQVGYVLFSQDLLLDETND